MLARAVGCSAWNSGTSQADCPNFLCCLSQSKVVHADVTEPITQCISAMYIANHSMCNRKKCVTPSVCFPQEVLHVHVPHYVDMFERIMAGPRPHRFAHLYLPGGSASLGKSASQR